MLVWIVGVLALIAIIVARKMWSDALGAEESTISHALPEDKEKAAINARRMQLRHTMVASVAMVVIIGAFVWLAVLLPELDKRQQEPRKALYLAGYQEIWSDQCDWIFFDLFDTPNGVLFNGDVPYDAAWCKSLQRVPEELPEDFGAEAYQQGQRNSGNAVDAVSARIEILCFQDLCLNVENEWDAVIDRQMRWQSESLY